MIDNAIADVDSLHDDDDKIDDDKPVSLDTIEFEAFPPANRNPWAPPNRDPPPKDEPVAGPQRPSAAQPSHQQLLEKTLTAVTSLLQCAATLTATMNRMCTSPLQAKKTDQPPQPRRTGVQPPLR